MMTVGDDDPRLGQLDTDGSGSTQISWRAPNRLLRSLFTDAYRYDRWPGINSPNDAVAQACEDIARIAAADDRRLIDVLAALDQDTGDLPLIVLGNACVHVDGDEVSLLDCEDPETIASALLERGYSRADLEAALDRATSS